MNCLLIENTGALYTKWYEERDQLSGLIKEGNFYRRESKSGNENINGSLFGMTYISLEGKTN